MNRYSKGSVKSIVNTLYVENEERITLSEDLSTLSPQATRNEDSNKGKKKKRTREE
jgi:hypothetical protein